MNSIASPAEVFSREPLFTGGPTPIFPPEARRIVESLRPARRGETNCRDLRPPRRGSVDPHGGFQAQARPPQEAG